MKICNTVALMCGTLKRFVCASCGIISVKASPRVSNDRHMNHENSFTEIRAGVISSLVLAIGYLYVTGCSSQLRVWAFMILIAVCFVLMMKSLVDLLTWVFDRVAAMSGRGLGKTVRFIRC